MRKKATNLTLSDEIRTRAHAVMAARGFSSVSAYVEQLIREEYDRRQSTAAAPINSAPSPAFQAIFEAAVAAARGAQSAAPLPIRRSTKAPPRRKVGK